jgi:hypothetical protein
VNKQLIVADAKAKAQAYEGLAERYLRAGETFLALHAQIAADVARAVSLGTNDPMGFARGRDGHSVLERAIARTSALPWNRLPVDANPQDTLEWLRRFISLRLPLGTVRKWRKSLAPADRFAFAAPVDPQLATNFATLRVGQRDPYQWVNAKFRAADLYADRARALLDYGSQRQALRAWFASDLAAFEAWLVSRSLAAGDKLLVQTELRWQLAMAAIEQISSLPEGYEQARTSVRSRLAWAVGPEAAEDLANHLNRL